jgi:hypothetical protein
MALIRYLGWIPPIGTLMGPIMNNAVHPFIFGMPFILGWTVAWLLLTPVIMGFVYFLDPANKVADGLEGDVK